MSALISLAMTPKEVEKVIDYADEDSNGVSNSEYVEVNDWVDIKIKFGVDMTDAVPKYRLGAIEYGPIDLAVTIHRLNIKIDWHNALNIGNKVCLTIKDPCGNVIIDECVKFNLGVSTLVLPTGPLPPSRFSVGLLDLRFQDNGGAGFDLKGDLPFVGVLFDLLVAGVVRAATALLGDFIEQLLRAVFGGGWIADRLIDLVKSIFAIFDKAFAFMTDVIKIALQPLDEALHKLFKDKIELTLKKDAIPKNFVVLKATQHRPEVAITLKQEPTVGLNKDGLYLEIME